MAIELITMGWARMPIMGRRIIMRTRICVVRLAAIILMERRILMTRWVFVKGAGILVMRIAIKLVMLTKLIMRVEIVLVHGAIWIWAMVRPRVKALGLFFVKGILVGISMLAARKLWFIGIDRRTRETLPPIMPRRTGRTGRTRRAIVGRRARRRRGWRGWRRRRRWGPGGRRRRPRGRRWGTRGTRRTIRNALAMHMSDVDGRLWGPAIVAILVAVIGLADAQRSVALDDGVRVGAARVDGGGGDEGEVKEGEQENITSVDRHRHNDKKSGRDRDATGE
jgi:hypothetical protein